jgi:ABC-type nitrate/sulfonate/bicarbonate transport system ATPase subunit
MDEPFGALDFLARLKMRADLVRIWQSEKKTILFVTHDIEEAIQLANRVLVMSNRPATISATGSDKVERAGTSNGGDFPDSQAHAHDAGGRGSLVPRYFCRGCTCGLIKSRKLLLRTFVFRFV